GAWALQPLLQLCPAHRVHDVPPLEPATSRLVDTVEHEAQLFDAMRVAINDDLHAKFGRPLHMHIVEVEPLGLGVEFQSHVILPGGMEDVLMHLPERRQAAGLDVLHPFTLLCLYT